MNPKNPYEFRWRWWYSAIADWMIRNPGGTMQDCADEIGRSYNAVTMIANTDMFREHLAKRKLEWQQTHDFSIVSKTTQIAEEGLDLILAHMKAKKTAIPFRDIAAVTGTALERLGYGTTPSAPAVQVNNYGATQQVVAPVSISALEEARMAVRQVEQMRAQQSRAVPQLSAPPMIEEEPFDDPELRRDDNESEICTTTTEIQSAKRADS